MARQWVVPGETMVAVVFGAHLSGAFPVQGAISYVTSGGNVVDFRIPGPVPPVSGSITIELGLCSDDIRITPRFTHTDILVNDMGKAPADVQWMCSDVNISMRLVHYDEDVLNACLVESMGGGETLGRVRGGLGGGQGPAGTLMFGNLKAQITRSTPPAGQAFSPFPTDISGCHYIGLSLQPQRNFPLPRPWYFYSTYLSSPPVVVPLGTKYQMVELNWRAVPVPGFLSTGEIVSSGSYIWEYFIPGQLYRAPTFPIDQGVA